MRPAVRPACGCGVPVRNAAIVPATRRIAATPAAAMRSPMPRFASPSLIDAACRFMTVSRSRSSRRRDRSARPPQWVTHRTWAASRSARARPVWEASVWVTMIATPMSSPGMNPSAVTSTSCGAAGASSAVSDVRRFWFGVGAAVRAGGDDVGE